MNRKVLIVLNSFIYVLIIFLSCFYIIVPSIKKYNSLEYYSADNINKLIDDVNKKYDSDYKALDELYDNKRSDLSKKYDDLNNELKEEYKLKINNSNNEYSSKIKEITKKISDVENKRTNEFWSNGFSKKYYDLVNSYLSLIDEKNSLSTEQFKEESKLNSELDNKIFDNNILLNREKDLLDENLDKDRSNLIVNKNEEISKINNHNNDVNGLKNNYIKFIIIGIIIIFIPLIYIIFIYNYLKKLLNRVHEKWSQIDVALKERNDLIPNIVNVVKGYSKYENKILVDVINARNDSLNYKNKEDEIIKNEKLNGLVNDMIVLFEDYPDLKSNDNFMGLQNTLIDLENKISNLRKDYNKSVLSYKNVLDMFPSNMYGKIFKFKEEPFFDYDGKNSINIEL